jgi:hypothetical protein
MKVKLTFALFALSAFAFAQPGAGHGSVGASMGSVGHGASAEYSGTAPLPHEHGPNAPSDTGKRSPTEVLAKDTKLASNLDKLLPKGMTAQQACSGFKKLGQCVAAIHVSHNLDIPFADLKSKVTGTGAVSLGKAIEQLKPTADAKNEIKKAKKQADSDLQTES